MLEPQLVAAAASLSEYEQQYRSRVLVNLQRRAKSLGFVLQAIPVDANPAVS
jgi:transposase